MLRMIAFNALLLGSCAYALLRGGAPERIVAGSLLAAYAATLLAYSELSTRFDQVEIAVLAVDALLLCVLVTVALRADRGWPLVVAGLHLTTIGAHLVKFFDANMIPVTYAVMIAVWSYPMLIALAAGTWRHRRRLRVHGHDNAWTRPAIAGKPPPLEPATATACGVGERQGQRA